MSMLVSCFPEQYFIRACGVEQGAWLATHIGQGTDVVDNVSQSGHEGGKALTQIGHEAGPTGSRPSIVAVARITSVTYAPECCQTVDGFDPSP